MQNADGKRSWRLDTTALRSSREFRLLWSSGAVTFLGSMVTYVALPFQLKELTGSFVAVGLLGAIQLVPLIVFGLWGGALADALDRRRMVLLTEVGLLGCSTVLLLNAVAETPRVWVVYVVAAVFTTLDALQRPSLDSIVPRVVPADQLAGAAALQSLRFNVGMILGPALGGVVIAAHGVGWGYGIDVASYVLSLVLILRMRPVPAQPDAERPSLSSITDGIRYAWSRKDLLGTYVIDMVAMLLAFPVAVYPFVAERFPEHPWLLGMLYSALAIGSLIATLTSGWTRRVHRHGRAIAIAATVWGLAIAGFGLADQVWLLLLFLVLAGAADMISGVFRSVIWNMTIPDALRGRLAGIELLSYATGPQLGQVRVSSVAALTSLRFSIVSGGVLCAAATGALAGALPALWRYDDRTNEHAVNERARRASMEGEDGR